MNCTVRLPTPNAVSTVKLAPQLYAFKASIMPQPYVLFGLVALSAVCIRASRSMYGVYSGWAESSWAATPATNGQEKDVPLPDV